MLNYRHLYYFWMVAKEGGFARAADRLNMAVQTISAQVRDLEKALGHQPCAAGRMPCIPCTSSCCYSCATSSPNPSHIYSVLFRQCRKRTFAWRP